MTWVGDVAPYGGLNRALITFFPGGMTGTLRVASNDGASQLELATYGNTTWLIDSAASGVTLLGPGDQADVMANMANMPATAPAKAKSGVAATGTLSTALPATDAMKNFPRSPVTKAGTDVSQVDVLIMATTELNEFYGGDAQTKAVMDRLIAFSNQVFMDSGVTNLRLNLVNNGTLAGTQSMKIEQILDGFNPARPEYIKTSNIADFREQVGADLVAILVTQDSTLNGGHCGSADLPMLQRDLATQASEMMSVTASGPAFRGAEFRCGVTRYLFMNSAITSG